RTRSEKVAKKFYEALIPRNHSIFDFNQELTFLSEIDRYRYSKYYKIPKIAQLLKIDANKFSSKCPRYTVATMARICDDCNIEFELPIDHKFFSKHVTGMFVPEILPFLEDRNRGIIVDTIFWGDYTEVIRAIDTRSIEFQENETCDRGSQIRKVTVRLMDLVEKGLLGPEFEQSLQHSFEYIFNDASSALAFVIAEESTEIFPSLDI
ncbi:MAG: hypothetical protein GY834_13155, partial [Bacteroidetes bacterium]|nr:hypothetical protein [Bacteroidota bacterium]